VDVLVLDEEALRENVEPGGVASVLLAGYSVLYDELGLEELVANAPSRLLSPPGESADPRLLRRASALYLRSPNAG